MPALRPTKGCRYRARVDIPALGLKALDELPKGVIPEGKAYRLWCVGKLGVIDERVQAAPAVKPLTRETFDELRHYVQTSPEFEGPPNHRRRKRR